ncbi:MAG: Panacea domain-containing protein, partial [Candidatus Paceibacterota bacterium]
VLYKLLYFIDFDYYEKYEEQLMGLAYFKNTHGPTPRSFSKIVKEMKDAGDVEEVKSKYFSRDQKKFLPHTEADLSVLNGQELEMIDDVLRRYADKSASQLSELSHRDMPWKATKDHKDIEYELVFYRSEEFSVRDYEEL